MNLSVWFVACIMPIVLCYPRHNSNEINRFLNSYVRQSGAAHDGREGEGFMSRRQPLFRLMPLNYHHSFFQHQQQQQQQQPQITCLPEIWTCGPGLPPCCRGLMCYDGNAKRGRYCVARG